jgi:hypothetical protein
MRECIPSAGVIVMRLLRVQARPYMQANVNCNGGNLTAPMIFQAREYVAISILRSGPAFERTAAVQILLAFISRSPWHHAFL